MADRDPQDGDRRDRVPVSLRPLPREQALALFAVAVGLFAPWWRPNPAATSDPFVSPDALTWGPVDPASLAMLLAVVAVSLVPSYRFLSQWLRALFGVYVLALPLRTFGVAHQAAELATVLSAGLLSSPDALVFPSLGAVLLVYGGLALVATNVFRGGRDVRRGGDVTAEDGAG